MKNKIILISGPTASGKSNFAYKVAKKINGEIINADSIQIYKDLKILTARPNIKDSDPVHHLYGFLGGEEIWSVGKWIKVAKDISDKIIAKKMTPIIVGGTGLYFKAITEGLSPIPDIDPKVREELTNLLRSKGINSLRKILKDLDPAAYKKIGSNDQQRILRALEVYKGTKRKISDFWKIKRVKLFNNEFKKINLTISRDLLYENCDKRCDEMINQGAIEEVRTLLEKNYKFNAPVMNAIGVKEIRQYLEKKIELIDAVNLIKYRTHQYAKRQITWSKHQMITWEGLSTQLSDKIVDNFIKKL
tara:strand:- start:106 stop:1017 length:912 start_codon:yes stop_codon:yes gene_type:complete